jgi:hypothetical protein
MAGKIARPGVRKLFKPLHLANQEHHNNDHEKQAGPATANIVKVCQQGRE